MCHNTRHYPQLDTLSRFRGWPSVKEFPKALLAFMYFSVQFIAHLSSLFRIWSEYSLQVYIFPPSFLVLTSSVPKSQTHWLKQISDIVLYILENSLNWSTCWVFTSLIDWNKTGEFFINKTSWTFVYLLGFFLNLKYKVIRTFSTIWQHTFISTEESCFDITQLQKYLQTLKHCNWPLQNLVPHVPCDYKSTSSCPRPELCVGAGHCSKHAPAPVSSPHNSVICWVLTSVVVSSGRSLVCKYFNARHQQHNRQRMRE